MQNIKRNCPQCNIGKLDSSELYQQVRCPYCHRTIAVDWTYSLIAFCTLTLICTYSFRYDYGLVGLVFLGVHIVYAIFVNRINARYCPLKTLRE